MGKSRFEYLANYKLAWTHFPRAWNESRPRGVQFLFSFLHRKPVPLITTTRIHPDSQLCENLSTHLLSVIHNPPTLLGINRSGLLEQPLCVLLLLLLKLESWLWLKKLVIAWHGTVSFYRALFGHIAFQFALLMKLPLEDYRRLWRGESYHRIPLRGTLIPDTGDITIFEY